MNKILLICLATSFLIRAGESWADGVDTSGGDPVEFQMPSEHFFYTCQIAVRGRASDGDGFIWARKIIEFDKNAFKANSGDRLAVYARYVTADDKGWTMTNIEADPPSSILPSFFQGHEILMQMTMGANVNLPIDEPVVKVFTRANLDSIGSVTSHSEHQPFSSFSELRSDLSFSHGGSAKFIGVTATCARTN